MFTTYSITLVGVPDTFTIDPLDFSYNSLVPVVYLNIYAALHYNNENVSGSNSSCKLWSRILRGFFHFKFTYTG